MFQQMQVANDSRHEEARQWHNQQNEWHKEHEQWHDEHTRMYQNQHSWHLDFVKWNQVFYNEMTSVMDDCRQNPGIMENFRNVDIQNRFRRYQFMTQNPDINPPPPPPPPYNYDESCDGHNP